MAGCRPQAHARGDGLIFYSWSAVRRDERINFEEYWADMVAVGEEIKRHVPALLSIEPNPTLEVLAPEGVHWTARTLDSTTSLFVVNSGDEGQQVTVRNDELPDGELVVAVDPLGLTVAELGL